MMHHCIILLYFSLLTFTNVDAEWGWLPNQRTHMQGIIDRDNPTPSTWNGAPIGIATIRPSQSRASDIPITMDTRHDQQYGADDIDNYDDDMAPQIYMEPETTYIPYISSSSSTAAGDSNQIVSSTSTPTPIPISTPTLTIATPVNNTYTETFQQYVTHLHDMWCQWMPCNIPTSGLTAIPKEMATPTTTPTPSITFIAPITPTTSITPIPATSTGSSIDISDMNDVDTSTNDPIHHNIHDDPIYDHDDVYDGDEEAFFPSTTSIPSVDQEDVNATVTTVSAYESMNVPSDVIVTPIQSITTTPTEYIDDDIFPEMTSFALDTSSQSDAIAFDTSSQSDPFSSACSMIATQLSYTRWWLCFFSTIFCFLLFILLRLEWMQQQQDDKQDDMEINEKDNLMEKEMSSHYRLLPTQVIRGADSV